MTDKPILFSAPMVQALLEGRKTQTRRVIKPQPTFIESSGRWKWEIPKAKQHGCDAVYSASREWHEYILPHQRPWHAVGVRLWVRETWSIPDAYLDGHKPDLVIYKSTPWAIPGAWRPSIFMPRWASRITLIVEGVKVERLQDISSQDAIAEGIEKQFYEGSDPQYRGMFAWKDYADHPHAVAGFRHEKPVLSYRSLWDHINGEGAWDANPWVTAYTFRVIKGNIDQIGGEP